jgi:hypothetical protein
MIAKCVCLYVCIYVCLYVFIYGLRNDAVSASACRRYSGERVDDWCMMNFEFVERLTYCHLPTVIFETRFLRVEFCYLICFNTDI